MKQIINKIILLGTICVLNIACGLGENDTKQLRIEELKQSGTLKKKYISDVVLRNTKIRYENYTLEELISQITKGSHYIENLKYNPLLKITYIGSDVTKDEVNYMILDTILKKYDMSLKKK